MGFYDNKKVLVTGGSAGIGRAIALEMAKRGADVIVTARGIPKLEDTVEALKAAGKPEQTFGYASFDVSDEEAVAAGVQSAIEQLGHLDVLICNSGFAKCGTSWDITGDTYKRLYDVNFLGHVNVVKAVVPHMRERKSGDICLLSSMLGFFSVYGFGAYSASKYAITGFGEALRQELLFDNVNVKLFYPPTTETPGLEAENEDKPAIVWAVESENSFTKVYTPEQVATSVANCVPKKRFENMIGFDSWLVFVAYRMFPRFARYMADQELRAAKKKVEARAS
ncbi:MAG: SDR family oxidoreductase [Proteobacteria bacterium]|nr:SDR family oxidoreductase [Pseudomonadota bacterium]